MDFSYNGSTQTVLAGIAVLSSETSRFFHTALHCMAVNTALVHLYPKVSRAEGTVEKRKGVT